MIKRKQSRGVFVTLESKLLFMVNGPHLGVDIHFGEGGARPSFALSVCSLEIFDRFVVSRVAVFSTYPWLEYEGLDIGCLHRSDIGFRFYLSDRRVATDYGWEDGVSYGDPSSDGSVSSVGMDEDSTQHERFSRLWNCVRRIESDVIKLERREFKFWSGRSLCACLSVLFCSPGGGQ